MLIRNRNLANHELNVPEVGLVKGDGHGVFDVPDEFGRRLCRTPGWSEHQGVQGALQPTAIKAAPPAPRQAVQNASAVAQESQSLDSRTVLRVHQPNPAPIPVPEAPPEPPAAPEGAPAADAEEEGPDLDAASKEQLLLIAAEYGVEVRPTWGEKRLRSVLNTALYDGEDTPAGEDDDAAKGE